MWVLLFSTPNNNIFAEHFVDYDTRMYLDVDSIAELRWMVVSMSFLRTCATLATQRHQVHCVCIGWSLSIDIDREGFGDKRLLG